VNRTSQLDNERPSASLGSKLLDGASSWGGRFVPLVLAIGVWEIVSRSEVVNPRLFPPPSQVVLALYEWVTSGYFWDDVQSSYVRMLAGFAVGGLLGVVFGMLTGRTRWGATLGPILQVFRPLPPVAIIPLVIVWLGIGDTAKIFSIAFAVFFPVWINTHLGAESIPREYLWSARMLGASARRTALRIVFPAALPAITAGLRTSVALAFVMVYVSEIAGAASGIGYRISITHLAYRIDFMMAALLVLALAGAVADWLLARLMNVLFPWLRWVSKR
jgi:ABC-type nitrate/sulfonate/bicarbonate transport system permease component